MNQFKDEIWKEIKNFEGFYEISNYGRVRSVDRIVYFKNNKGSRFYKGKILKQKYHKGYAMVNLNKNKNLKVCYIHILVATHFLDNPNNLPIVNHKDGIKSNNHFSNLEYCTSKYNNEHAIKNNLVKNNVNGLLKLNKENSLKLACYKNNELLYIANCSRDLANWLINNNYVQNTNIESVARAIRRFSKENANYYNLTIKRLNIVKSSRYNNNFQIAIIKNEKILIILNTSNECAEWLINNNYISNACKRTVSRAIRKSLNNNKSYHNFIFKKIDK